MHPNVSAHPFARHPIAGPLLRLVEPRPEEPNLRDALRAELEIQRRLAIRAVCAQAEHHLQVGPVRAWRQAAGGLDEVLNQGLQAEAWPHALIAAYRPSAAGGLGEVRALELATAVAQGGPEAARLACGSPRTTALRRLVNTGVWPGYRPRFIGRLCEVVTAEAYAPTLALVTHLIEQEDWQQASTTARRMRPALRRQAQRTIIVARVRGGAPARLQHIDPQLHDAVWTARALRAAEQRDEHATQHAWSQVAQPRASGWAALLLCRQARAMGEANNAMRWLRLARPHCATGDWCLQALEQASPLERLNYLGLFTRLCMGPRRSTALWQDGLRPDRRLAEYAAVLALQGCAVVTRVPQLRVRNGWLDSLDVALQVVRQVGSAAALDPSAQRLLPAQSQRLRLHQAAWVARYQDASSIDLGHPSVGRPEVAAFVRGLMGDEQFKASLSRDPADPARAFYDDGLARSPVAGRHRHALVRASKQTLHRHREGSQQPARDVLRVRIATLSEVAGEKAKRVLSQHLEAAAPKDELRAMAASALAKVNPQQIVAKMMQDPLRYGNGVSGDNLRAQLEAGGWLPSGYTRASHHLLQALKTSPSVNAEAWWAGLCQAAWAGDRRPLSPDMLNNITALRAWDRRQPPQDLLRQLSAELQSALQLPLEQWITRVLEDHKLLSLLLACTAPSPGRGNGWSPMLWRTLIDASHFAPRRMLPVPSLVHRWAKSVHPAKAKLIAERLLQGRAPLPELDVPVDVGYAGLRLRYLGKVKDAFRFLRFADCVPCCFTPGPGAHRGYGTMAHVLKLWRDPLSFCFHVEDERHHPVGFVFGGYGRRLPSDSALLLNGLYLKRKHRLVREAVLRSIERCLARPLGLSWVGIGNRYGGFGALPADYRAEPASVFRLRALSTGDGTLLRRNYDDISTVTNAVAPVRLHWAKLSERLLVGEGDAVEVGHVLNSHGARPS